MKYCIPLCLAIILLSCESRKQGQIAIEVHQNPIGSLYITESITERLVSVIPINTKNTSVPNGFEATTIGIIQTKEGGKSRLTILSPNKSYNIQINPDSTITTSNIADSLLNYLWKSNNKFIAQNQQFLFTTSALDSIIRLFDKFRLSRKNEIERHTKRLAEEEKELLLHQNNARINSFLFFFGRIAKNLSPDNSFFQFADHIDNNTKWTKSLPQNLLYKHEINYLKKQDSLTDISTFLKYVETQTSNQDLLSFLKAIYLREIIETPSYWERHQTLFNSEVLNDVIEKEKDSPYYDLIKRSSDNYFSSSKGTKAYDFTAKAVNGKDVKLSDLAGKLVFIDSWASWCGPCIRHRPKVLELAQKYKDNPRVEVLMILVDATKEDWINYLSKKDELDIPGDLIIENGMRTKYGDRFNIKSIPRYMLIDPNGIIIDGNTPEPSQALEDIIKKELKKIQ